MRAAFAMDQAAVVVMATLWALILGQRPSWRDWLLVIPVLSQVLGSMVSGYLAVWHLLWARGLMVRPLFQF